MTNASELFRQAAAALDRPPGTSSGGSADPRPRPECSPIDRDEVWEALGTVIDPEIGLDIVTLGLVYGLEIEGGAVRVTFTLTTPGCPMEEAITAGVIRAVVSVPGVAEVLPELVWDPRWNPGMIQEGAW